MACLANGNVAGKKKKMTWKECCNKWGRAAMEQQQGSRGPYTIEVGKDQLAANIFAFIPNTEWHKYYVARIGLSSEALKLKYAITFGEVYEFDSSFNRCPECDCAIDEHRCDECSIRFKKSDDNIMKNMNETARALGGWDNYYAATWKQFEAAKDDMLEVAPTAGMLEKRAREAEKLLGKKAKRHEVAEVQQLWEKYEEAKEIEAEEETFFEHEASLLMQEAPKTYKDNFPQLGKGSEATLVVEKEVPVKEASTGFFFGEIPALVELPKIPILEILPAAPVLNLNGELNEQTQPQGKDESIDEVEKDQVKPVAMIQSGFKKYELVGNSFQRVKKLPKTLYPWGEKSQTPGKVQHTMITKWVRKTMNQQAEREEKNLECMGENERNSFCKEGRTESEMEVGTIQTREKDEERQPEAAGKSKEEQAANSIGRTTPANCLDHIYCRRSSSEPDGGEEATEWADFLNAFFEEEENYVKDQVDRTTATTADSSCTKNCEEETAMRGNYWQESDKKQIHQAQRINIFVPSCKTHGGYPKTHRPVYPRAKPPCYQASSSACSMEENSQNRGDRKRNERFCVESAENHRSTWSRPKRTFRGSWGFQRNTI
ncbi:P1N-PISPO [Sweet potato virus G]|uniref:P1N-PISPO n=1 Tax=Sweet potato virus G TaxID=46619 RepID=UPI000B92BC25|nr:P1N-PISPO [Sweet potato virus G]